MFEKLSIVIRFVYYKYYWTIIINGLNYINIQMACNMVHVLKCD